MSTNGIWVAAFLLAASLASARPQFLGIARQTLPLRSGGTVDRASCSLCHAPAGPPDLNPFGNHLHQVMNTDGTETLTPALLRSLLSQDSDGDGYLDGEEIAADTLPGDPRSHPKRHSGTSDDRAQSAPPKNSLPWACVFLARHAQHPVIAHFPIALFIVSLVLDFFAFLRHDRRLAWAAKLNLQIAAGTSLLTIATGLLAWQLKFGGAPLTGVLMDHLIGGLTFAAAAWAMLGIRRKRSEPNARYLAVAAIGLFAVVVTGHLGGVLSGVAG